MTWQKEVNKAGRAEQVIGQQSGLVTGVFSRPEQSVSRGIRTATGNEDTAGCVKQLWQAGQ